MPAASRVAMNPGPASPLIPAIRAVVRRILDQAVRAGRPPREGRRRGGVARCPGRAAASQGRPQGLWALPQARRSGAPSQGDRAPRVPDQLGAGRRGLRRMAREEDPQVPGLAPQGRGMAFAADRPESGCRLPGAAPLRSERPRQARAAPAPRPRVSRSEAEKSAGIRPSGSSPRGAWRARSTTCSRRSRRSKTLDDDEAAHRARIAAKKVRYILEPALRGAETKNLKGLKAFQDAFGEFHDLGAVRPRVVEALHAPDGPGDDMTLCCPPGLARIIGQAERERRAIFREIRREYLGDTPGVPRADSPLGQAAFGPRGPATQIALGIYCAPPAGPRPRDLAEPCPPRTVNSRPRSSSSS